MCSYNAWRGTPACASGELLTGLLRGQMGFAGFVVTDKFGEPAYGYLLLVFCVIGTVQCCWVRWFCRHRQVW